MPLPKKHTLTVRLEMLFIDWVVRMLTNSPNHLFGERVDDISVVVYVASERIEALVAVRAEAHQV